MLPAMSAPEVWTVRRLLEWTGGFFERKGIDEPRRSAEALLAHVLGVSRIRLYTDYDKLVAPHHLENYRALVRRAAEQEPIDYLTGTTPFFNLEFRVTPDVLIPRPDTETLLEHALQMIRYTPGFESPRVLDLGTGSGCIAAAMASRLPEARVVAVEVSPAAAAIARENFQRLGLADRITLLEGDLFDPLRQLPDPGPFHLVLSNPPYIPTASLAELDRSVRDYEPHLALDGGLDGLCVHRRIIDDVAAHLLPGGHAYLEIAFDQGSAALRLLDDRTDLIEPRILRDHGGRDRVLTFRRA